MRGKEGEEGEEEGGRRWLVGCSKVRVFPRAFLLLLCLSWWRRKLSDTRVKEAEASKRQVANAFLARNGDRKEQKEHQR